MMKYHSSGPHEQEERDDLGDAYRFLMETAMAKPRDNPTADVSRLLREASSAAVPTPPKPPTMHKCGLCDGVGRGAAGICPACRGSGLTERIATVKPAKEPTKEPEKPVLQQSASQFRDRLKARMRAQAKEEPPVVGTNAKIEIPGLTDGPDATTEVTIWVEGAVYDPMDLSSLEIKFASDGDLIVCIPDTLAVRHGEGAFRAALAEMLENAANRIARNDMRACGPTSTHYQTFRVPTK